MNELFEEIAPAEEMGQISALVVAAGLESVEAMPLPVQQRNPGGGMGPLALAVYRDHGRNGLLHMCQYFHAGYKSMADRVGASPMSQSAVKNGVIAVLPSEATEEEKSAITEAVLATEDEWAAISAPR